jgi:peptidoglycan/xylan/chitin deacetylase (PgdA/CDA1 family)
MSTAESQPELLALRLDDVGASSKKFEVYSEKNWQFGPVKMSANWLFLKYLPAYKSWGPYRELRATEWLEIQDLLENFAAKLTVAVTAAWVEAEGNLIPFPEKFPEEAAAIKAGVGQGLLEVANHGLTHCVVKDNLFRPKLFSSNRSFHREFGTLVSIADQDEHLRKSQQILEDWLGIAITTFVPPGNQFTEDTLPLVAKHGLSHLSANTPPQFDSRPIMLGNQNVMAFHDRDIVLGGSAWLRSLLERNEGRQFVFVSELAKQTVELHGH